MGSDDKGGLLPQWVLRSEENEVALRSSVTGDAQ